MSHFILVRSQLVPIRALQRTSAYTIETLSKTATRGSYPTTKVLTQLRVCRSILLARQVWEKRVGMVARGLSPERDTHTARSTGYRVPKPGLQLALLCASLIAA